MAVLLPSGKQAFEDGAGRPLVGGLVFTYAAGTNTPLPTYADAKSLVPNTNPVVLDARGEATIFWSGSYKVVLKDAAGVTIWTQDNVSSAGSEPVVFADLAALQAASPLSLAGTLKSPSGPITYGFVYADYTGKADGVSVVKQNNTPLSTGAWVRQSVSATSFVAEGVGAKELDGQTKARQFRTAKDFGATGLLAQDDEPGVRAHFDVEGPYASNRGGHATLNKGRYRLSKSIDLKSYSDFSGEGPRASIFDQEDAPVAYAAFKWTYDNILYGFAAVSDVGVRGFTHGVLISEDTDEIALRRMHIYAASVAAIQVDGFLQTGVMDEIKMESSAAGLVSNSIVCNAMRLTKCDTRNISGEHIHLNGAEDCVIASHRFEGGGQIGGYTLNIANARELAFDGGYMESTHQYAARIVNTIGEVDFCNFHFTGTGAKPSGVGAYDWLTDGTGGLSFRNCHSIYPMRVPAHASLEGSRNHNLIACIISGSLVARPRRPGSTDFALLRFTRLNTAVDAGNITTLRGTLEIDVTYLGADGAFAQVRRSVSVLVVARGNALTVNATTIRNDDVGAGTGATFTGLTESAASGLLTIQLPGLNSGSAPVYSAEWRVTWNQYAALDQNTFSVEVQ